MPPSGKRKNPASIPCIAAPHREGRPREYSHGQIVEGARAAHQLFKRDANGSRLYGFAREKNPERGATELWLHYQHGDAVVGWLNVLNAESSVPGELLPGTEILECGGRRRLYLTLHCHHQNVGRFGLAVRR